MRSHCGDIYEPEHDVGEHADHEPTKQSRQQLTKHPACLRWTASSI